MTHAELTTLLQDLALQAGAASFWYGPQTNQSINYNAAFPQAHLFLMPSRLRAGRLQTQCTMCFYGKDEHENAYSNEEEAVVASSNLIQDQMDRLTQGFYQLFADLSDVELEGDTMDRAPVLRKGSQIGTGYVVSFTLHHLGLCDEPLPPPVLALAQLFVIGDSHADGYLLPNPATQKWPALLLAGLPGGKFGPLVSTATAGDTTLQQQAKLAGLLAQVDAATYGLSVFLVQCGSNDISTGATVAQVRQRRQALIASIRQYAATLPAGHRVVIILTSIQRNGKEHQGVSRADFEAMRTELNTEAFAQYQLLYGADYYVNFDAAPELYDPYNETYYHPDRQHVNVAGNAVESATVRPYVLAAYAGTPLAPAADYVPTPGGGGEGELTLLETYQETAFDISGGGWQTGISLGGTTFSFTNEPGSAAGVVLSRSDGKQFTLTHGDYSGNGYFGAYEVWVNGAKEGEVNMPDLGPNTLEVRYTSAVYAGGITSVNLISKGFLPVDRLELYG